MQELIPQVVKKILPAVVSITISKNLPVYEQQPSSFFGFDNFFDVPKTRKKVKVGGGSGFIVDSSGLILTNRHVIADPKAEYIVILDNEKQYRAQILASDPLNDIAILAIKAKNLPTLTLGNSFDLNLGQTIIAVGNVLGTFRNTVSVGVVSGLSREIMGGDMITGQPIKMRRLIQTDAAINPGNSGGPLINLAGEVVGINTAVVFLAENVGFALPINPAKRDLEHIQKYGKIKTPFLGVRYIPITKALSEKYNLAVKQGALLVPMGLEKPLVANGPAAKAGLQEQDIILEAGKEKITLKNSLEEILQKFEVGDEVELKILRRKKKITLKAKLGEKS